MLSPPDHLNDPVITLRAVVELDDAGSWLELDGACTTAQAELFVNALAGVGGTASPAERITTVIEDEMPIVLGGLLLTETTTGASVHPGHSRAWRTGGSGRSAFE